MNRRGKRWIFRLIDTIIIVLSIYFAFSIRFDLFQAWKYIPEYYDIIYLIIPIKLICFWFVGTYRPVIRYVGFEFLSTAGLAVICSSGVIAITGLLFFLQPLPRSVLILDALITLILLVSVRVLIRWIVYHAISDPEEKLLAERVIIYGAGAAGSELANALIQQKDYKPVAFIDLNPQLHKQVISGLTVYHPTEIARLIDKYKVDTILLAIPSLGKQKRAEVIRNIQRFGVTIKTIPRISEIVSGKVSINTIRHIDITDLLGREEIMPDPVLLRKNIKDQVVLVTGAGGSIGSELCRQILRVEPKKLLLFERNEFALYTIDMELREKFPELEIIPCLASVTDQKRMEDIFRQYGVETVYHAAAYKHVPLVEANMSAGIHNNIFGTLSCVHAATNCNVKTFVLISTDKAVRPTNVMGTTKRVAELVLQAFSKRGGATTRFVMVRFGNVLNSAGSVVPRFRKQIATGQDITLTHPEITRYFMSIPEASRLVIQAGALGKGGDVFLLDMGEPVKIYDLAKQMIELSGLELGKDININITGLRPGEKLYEELLIDKTKNRPTRHPKVFSAEEYSIPWEELSAKLELLFQVSEEYDNERILETLQSLVPEFTPDTQTHETSAKTKSNSGKIIPFTGAKPSSRVSNC